jgi:hypothetical protein
MPVRVAHVGNVVVDETAIFHAAGPHGFGNVRMREVCARVENSDFDSRKLAARFIFPRAVNSSVEM